MAPRADLVAGVLATIIPCVVLATAATSIRAQSPNRGVEFEDLGFSRPARPGARQAGISAFAASVSDATALVVNPAGLARVKRPHSVLGLARAEWQHDTRHGDASTRSEVDDTALDFAGAAFPIPVLRGSLVPAASVHRAFTSDLALHYTGYNAFDDRDDTFDLHQSGSTYAYTVGAALDLSPDISAGAALFVMDGDVHTLRQFDYRDRDPFATTHTFVVEESKLGARGVGGRVGLEVFAHPHLQLGLVVTSPQLVRLSGRVSREETRQVENDIGSFSRTETDTSTKYVLPYRFDGAIATPWRRILVAAQLSYTDWSQASIDQHRLVTRSAGTVLRTVYELQAGVEWSIPRWALRLRAGLGHARGVLEYLETDRIDGDRLERLASESGRTRLSLGAGILIRSCVSLDAAFAHTRAERNATTIGDRDRFQSVQVQGSYWF